MPPVNVHHQSTLILAALLLGSTMVGCSTRVPSEALRRKGDLALSIADWPAAAESYAELTRRDPTDWKSQANLGRAALEAGDLNTARQAFEIAAALRPADNAIARDLADTLEQQEAWDDLFAYLRDRANTTSTAEDWLRLARVAIEADDPDTARESIRTALAVDAGTSVGPYLRAARLARRLGDEQDAFRALALAWDIAPHDPDVGNALRDLGVVPGPTMRLTTGE
ncbi:MAG: tetratricopeptide repeat protein [Phycisphaerales bacterium]|jgi:tetratricopeptide (TPR) repeat protein|nr:tetratricopeptide repeat protein [Phycisphaerales bacterium]